MMKKGLLREPFLWPTDGRERKTANNCLLFTHIEERMRAG
ncbi:hypothetical protein HLBENOHH_04219 [Aeromonas dhakensis]